MERRFIILTQKGQAECRREPFAWDAQSLKPNEAVIQTSLSLISAGTELSRVYAIKQGFQYPVYPGYTSIGTVLAKGSKLSGIEVNDRVFYAGPHASINRIAHQGTTQGAKIMKIDPRLSDKQACLIQMGLIAMNAVTACTGKLTDTVCVYGLGAIGLIAALLLQKEGMRVLALDPVAFRCRQAEKLGLKETFDGPANQQGQWVKEKTQGRGADISVDASGISSVIVEAIDAAARHGQIILLGSPRAPYTADITPLLNAIHMKMLTVNGAFNELNPFSTTEGTRRSVLRDFETVQRLILDNTLDAEKLISQIIAPDQIMEAYHGLMYEKDRWLSVAIDWSR